MRKEMHYLTKKSSMDSARRDTEQLSMDTKTLSTSIGRLLRSKITTSQVKKIDKF
jgi:hypothetical protein